jgi:cellulose synthase/poly-beta-1,6-N-acetylglucosamine synthase-like glycosyltransferase/peptidoglycan/xylan/chitin deacetylase (PgdA/CDA1 family)/spore germination protein YaaH
MDSNVKPVFYSTNSSRWKRFLWIIKILSVLLFIGIASILISLFHKQVFKLPTLREHLALSQEDDQKFATADIKAKETAHFLKLAKEARTREGHDFYKRDKVIPGEVRKYEPIRAGFYVNWDIQSKFSLKQNASKLNMVLPEWLFVQDTSDEVATDIDIEALDIMQRNHLAVVPMVSNYFNNKFNGANVHRIITSPARRTKFINSLIVVLNRYHFNGVNIDFEDLNQEKTDEYLIAFQKELYAALHSKGFLVTQDIAPFNEDYNVAELAKHNDFLFLMGYDQYNSTSEPGPVAAQYWVEAALDELCKKVPSDKVVLCIAAHGYDWQEGRQGADVTYQEAITTALESEGRVKFDNKTYNLSYTYYDENDKLHNVSFVDAATDFNAMRTAADFETSGVAVWYLGSEDRRLWEFYNHDLSGKALSLNPFNKNILTNTQSSDNVDYVGAGEILNIITEPHPGKINIQVNDTDKLISEEDYQVLPSGYVIDKTGESPKKIVMTFDDGPDERYTPHILDILNKYKVPGVFFVTGINAEHNLPLVQRIYREGHEIGNHTFLHPNLEVASDDRLKLELRSTGYVIESITGHATMLFRPPYNTDAEPTNPVQIRPIFTAKSEGYLTIGSSIDPNDWQEGVSADTVVARAIKQQDLGNIILMHDAGGNRDATLEALPRIIEYYKAHGYQFVSLATLMNKNRDDIMPLANGTFNRYLESADATVFTASYYFNRIISVIFFLAMLLSIFKIVSLAILAIRQKKHSGKPMPAVLTSTIPKVSIIVPGYNEELTAPKTVENLLHLDYPDFEIVFVDDGSKDNTFKNIEAQYGDNPKVKVFTKPNGGKASALNYGIGFATGDILVCIDADTVLKPDAVTLMIPYFSDPLVAAVAGNVKVGNRKNLLTRWQSIEYITSQNFDRRAFDQLNAIMVVPGAIGAFRRDAVQKVGMFTTDTLAEDCDLTLRLLRAGYKVHTCNEAYAYTEVPETLNMLVKQRSRWTFGIMQSYWKHHDKMFVRKTPNLGWVVLPNMLIFQLILPVLSPLVDIMLLVSLFLPKGGIIMALYFGYYFLDLIISAMAFRFDGEKFTVRDAYNLFLQRILYRQVLWFVLVKGYLRAIKGELAAWGFLKRTGNVETV